MNNSFGSQSVLQRQKREPSMALFLSCIQGLLQFWSECFRQHSSQCCKPGLKEVLWLAASAASPASFLLAPLLIVGATLLSPGALFVVVSTLAPLISCAALLLIFILLWHMNLLINY
jgi:hypothetical protein